MTLGSNFLSSLVCGFRANLSGRRARSTLEKTTASLSRRLEYRFCQTGHTVSITTVLASPRLIAHDEESIVIAPLESRETCFESDPPFLVMRTRLKTGVAAGVSSGLMRRRWAFSA